MFDFEETVNVAFQMYDTSLPLSIAFISQDQVIVDIQDMEPLSKKAYTPAKPYRYAIEVNQGYFEANDIAVGDRVEFQETDSPDNIMVVFRQ